jgi:UDPglucose--hexose-1-phosphate uridylyltransferase
MGTFLFDELTGTPTLLATNRAKRTDQTGAVSDKKSDNTGQPKPLVDFFAKGNESLTPPTLYQDADDWNVRVFQNKFALVEDHEIVVHSPQADKDIEDMPLSQVVKIIRAYLNRLNYYTSRDKEVLIFNNRGGKAGASLNHPHSQIIALKGFPGIMEKEKEEALKYYNSKNRCYWCDEYAHEVHDNSRVVCESPHFVTFVPSACRWSYETIMVPKDHKPNMEYMNELEINDFALMLKSLLQAYDELFNRPDRNFWIHTMRFEPYHWHVGFIPQLKVMGGLELGAGIWVSDRATPEEAAAQLGALMSKYYRAERFTLA